jgi:hypothetical protein
VVWWSLSLDVSQICTHKLHGVITVMMHTSPPPPPLQGHLGTHVLSLLSFRMWQVVIGNVLLDSSRGGEVREVREEHAVELAWMARPDSLCPQRLRRSVPFRLLHCVSGLFLEVVVGGGDRDAGGTAEGTSGRAAPSVAAPVWPAGESPVVNGARLTLSPMSDSPG